MAYQLIYTYTGRSNYSGARTVPLSRFTVSGDTDKYLGQITGISYEHWHTSTYSGTWTLTGRLVFGDGTVIDSDAVSHYISGNIVQYTNTFTNLPAADKWSLLTEIQTLDQTGAISNDGAHPELYWRAVYNYPMRIIVSFIEEPPVHYAPEISSFTVQRANASGAADDEGKYIVTTMKLALGDSTGLGIAALRIYYAANAYPVVGESAYIDLTDKISTLINGVALNPTIITGEWSIASSWYFAAVFIAGDESDISTSSAPRASGSLHISGQPSGGVCVCGYSTGTTANPKFETHAPAYLYGGIAQIGDGTGNVLDAFGIQAGQTEEQRVGNDSSATFTITFPKAYSAPPVVVVSKVGGISGSYAGRLGLSVTSVTTNGCTVLASNGGAGQAWTISVAWMALGTPA